MPLLLRKSLFFVSLGLFALLLGALLGGAVFGSSSGHGLGGLASMLSGALVGLGVGIASAVILLARTASLPWGWLALAAGIGSGLVVGLILLMDALGRW